MNIRALGAAAAVAAFSTAAFALAEPSRDIDWNGEIPPGATFEVKAVNGSIEASAASDGRATVRLHATSADGDLAGVRLVVKHLSDRVVVCAVTPDETVSDDCEIHSHSTNNDRSIRTDLRVMVPRSSPFRARTVNGKVTIAGLATHVDAATVNGAVSIATSGSAHAATVNGSIAARLGEWRGALDLKTVNGSIAAYLPRRAGFSVHARTLTGRIDAGGFGLAANAHRFVGASLDGTVGANGDGRSLEAKTVNGSITIAPL